MWVMVKATGITMVVGGERVASALEVMAVTVMVKAGPEAMVAEKTAEATAAAMRMLMSAAAAVVEAAMAAQVTLAVTAVIAAEAVVLETVVAEASMV